MTLIDEIIKMDKEHDIKQAELDKMFKEIIEKGKKLSIDDFKDIQYKELKDIFKDIYVYMNDDLRNKVTELLNEKKVELYPILKTACYFPELNNIDFLSKEEIVKLDKELKNFRIRVNSTRLRVNELYSVLKEKENTEDLMEKILQFLLDNKIIEREYVLHCNCEEEDYNDFGCSKAYITETNLKKHKRAWELSKKDKTDEESIEFEKYMEDGFGYIMISCDRDCIEIYSQESFDKCQKYIQYMFIKSPDLTIDEL